MELVKKYFPQLTDQQVDQFTQLGPLYRSWNEKINVISRKDIDHLYDHHILHSLGIAKVIRFQPGAKVLDLGTGGGLPGIPLAIRFPDTRFTLIDGTRKKIKVAQDIIRTIGLPNVNAHHIRAEEMRERFDFVVCRAVASIDKLVPWSSPLLKEEPKHALPNGLITLKGGDIQKELKRLPKGSYTEVYPLSDYFEEEYYEKKYVVYVQD